jgi:hypothetical protein
MLWRSTLVNRAGYGADVLMTSCVEIYYSQREHGAVQVLSVPHKVWETSTICATLVYHYRIGCKSYQRIRTNRFRLYEAVLKNYRAAQAWCMKLSVINGRYTWWRFNTCNDRMTSLGRILVPLTRQSSARLRGHSTILTSLPSGMGKDWSERVQQRWEAC